MQNAESSPPVEPLGSECTSNFPEILEQFNISVLVTTYQANMLVILRSDGSRALNTHFRALPRPMGMAGDTQRLAVGTTKEIVYYRNMPAVAPKLAPAGQYDACYLLRSAQVTGDIDVHEMAWVGDELWFANTAFSCLCTSNWTHSFVPRWLPPFITALTPEDRCHLNGLAVVPDALGKPEVKYVTALAATDTHQGWRSFKKDGGILMDVPSGEILARGLCMPHSPRWHDGKLWMLESGRGAIGIVDLQRGRFETVAELPGFTRGFEIYGRYAFIGLSQVRDSAVFSGIPIAERALAERNCGVWMVDLTTGNTIAFLRFDAAVQEVFAIQVLRGIRYPEIAPDDPAYLSESYDVPSSILHLVPEPLRGR